MIIYSVWLFLVVISVSTSLVAFIWGLRTGQFSNQERARYLPLGEDLLSQPIPEVSRSKRRAHMAALCMMAGVAFIAFGAALTLALYHH